MKGGRYMIWIMASPSWGNSGRYNDDCGIYTLIAED
jgi:hypothetical protein